MALPPFLEKIVDWLRAGYPEGVPQTDYIPLIALLGSQLTNDEVLLIAHELEGADDPGSSEAIKKAIASVTDSPVNSADINRVRATLAGAGWPLAIPPRD